MSDAYLNQALRAGTPSNLAPTVERPLIELASDALLADLTGIGRDRFPRYLPGPAPAELYRDVRVQAAVARELDHDSVEVHLIWAGTDLQDRHVERRTAQVHLRYLDEAWTPVDL